MNSSILARLSLFSCVLLLASCAHGPSLAPHLSFAEAKAAYQKSDHSAAARSAYVENLARLAWAEMPKHQNREPHDCQIEAINAELKAHPAPTGGDTADPLLLSLILSGKWQSPRHTYLFASDGTWRFAPEDGEATGHWHIRGNRLTIDDQSYTLILLNEDFFVYADAASVFLHSRVRK